MSLELLGYFAWLAGAIGAIAWVPQLLTTWRRKSAKDISWGLLTLTCVALTAYTVYGLALALHDLLWAVAIQFLVVIPEMAMKAWYDGLPLARRRVTPTETPHRTGITASDDVDGLRW